MEEQEKLTLDQEERLEHLQKTIEELVRDHEFQMTTSTQKHDSEIKKLQQQSDTLQRKKEGLEQEKSDVKFEVNELKVTVESLSKPSFQIQAIQSLHFKV